LRDEKTYLEYMLLLFCAICAPGHIPLRSTCLQKAERRLPEADFERQNADFQSEKHFMRTRMRFRLN